LVAPQVGAESGLDNCGRSLLHDPELGGARNRTTEKVELEPGLELGLGYDARYDVFCGGTGREEVPARLGCEVAVPLGVAAGAIADGRKDTMLSVSKLVGSGLKYDMGTVQLMKKKNEITRLSLSMSGAKCLVNSVTETILPESSLAGSGGIITKHDCGRKGREDVPTEMLAAEYGVGPGVTIASVSTNTSITDEHCRGRTGNGLSPYLDTGRVNTFTKLFAIFEKDPAKRVALDRMKKMGSAKKQPRRVICTPVKSSYKANKINLQSPSVKRKTKWSDTKLFNHVTDRFSNPPAIVLNTTPNYTEGGGGLVKRLRREFEK
jgi:hypothetical protein